jgi:hypothetical protein
MKDRGITTTGISGTIAAATVLVALSAGPARCADAAPETPVYTIPRPSNEETLPGTVDKGHAGASERVQRLGAWVDRFFADENYEAEVNKSWLRIRLDSFSELYEGTDLDAKARLHLKVPALNKRLRFEILSPGEPDDLEATGGNDTGSLPPGAAEERTSAAVSYVYRALKERSIIARLGLNFDGYTPDPYVGGRYRELVSLNDDWNFRFTQRLRFYTLDGLESRTSLDFERVLEEDMLFRTSLNGTWLQENPDYFYSLGFALFRPLDEKSAVEYQVINSFKTDPHRLDDITVRIRHRQKIWRDWLTFELAPQVSFSDDRDFEPAPGILFRLEATFGG